MQNIAKHIFFSGRVQGVGFRYTVHRIAIRYDLTGFVHNLPDGRVEMLIQGRLQDIANCLQDIEQTFGSYIRETKVEQLPISTSYNSFEITF